ncbi:2,3-dihydro-2,3-dihydroxybenzoate dehydrogenase [Ketobacter sp. MCCC 1A13808]|uniref:2,3-dihydro-2,3-dihydroxybenzoate dehydrogenase n=1 Tax=Ketobacter sp. MCCC 1A13808 TaxID=2602738 RepID=UPI000F25EABA|nr:2,3-dihydro-2,3-dihydroxybenzoate dehydrogenase [Ketobacter sp. MCCC 1A13808]MVF11552.1 2,3-dihydro-2,3-dihydroxybenzoate dehydrogenase [Ketobacter sp. MCCC 1A13808]RLP53248.1 MAG: 2,3-dihydro-2,3-dihydroxybenzoate dehydrogenase [Ketobacter sp.]
MDFSGKTVWVTGAGQGIGFETALRFQKAGAHVIGIDRAFGNPEYPFLTVEMDLSDPHQIESVCARLTAQLTTDGVALDALVNAAGLLRLGSLQTLTMDDWHACMNVNAGGVFCLLKQLAPLFVQQKRGAIVNVASNAARVPRMQMAAYCASKAALVSLSHCVGLELAQYGIRCNLVSPGSTDTPMLRGMLKDDAALHNTIAGLPEQFKLGIPLQKIANVQDIANTILFLASDLAGHITLQDIVVDGGATLSA